MHHIKIMTDVDNYVMDDKGKKTMKKITIKILYYNDNCISAHTNGR